MPTLRRDRLRVTGTVQGVGFRPFVHRLAHDLSLAGWVLNDSEGVRLEVEGTAEAVALFVDRLRAEAPPLARIAGVSSEPAEPTGERGFRILGSDAGGRPEAAVSPDTATCEECLAELFDPSDRRHRYPFVNCTNCGPRFTIVKGVPYDRPRTTMAGFQMCEKCRAEYEDPLDRRYHAQPNACPACGPRARLVNRHGAEVAGSAREPVAAAAAALAAGKIVAVKGIGGYHLACRADREEAVAELRARKHREERPFALMVAGLEQAGKLGRLGEEERRMLGSRVGQIVLVPRRPAAAVAASVAPRSRELGLMLPYSPLHHLLTADLDLPLVMTSGNVSDEPIAFADADALERLGTIADALLVHDRPIHTRTDDSVCRAVDVGARRRPLLLRRSRGHVPESIELPVEAPRHLLACGAEQKSAFCLARGRRAWVGHHIGDLENFETLRSFEEGIEHFKRLFDVEPAVCAHDLHPDYLSTAYALERRGVETIGVQHHHAHLAACLAEHGESAPAVGAIFDGTGYGEDGGVWGGELLVGGLDGFQRRGHLRAVRMPGGAAAIRRPWRMACAWLSEALGPRPPLPASLDGVVEAREWRNCCRLLEDGRGSPPTTSMGRLFDAFGVLCGAPPRVTYEGQAAVELEALADVSEAGGYAIPLLCDEGEPAQLDPRPAFRSAVADLARGEAVGRVAARFHNGVAAATAAACAAIAEEAGVDTVALGGGVFQNRLLLERLCPLIDSRGLHLLVPERLPPNDGGICFGQAAIAAARLTRCG